MHASEPCYHCLVLLQQWERCVQAKVATAAAGVPVVEMARPKQPSILRSKGN